MYDNVSNRYIQELEPLFKIDPMLLRLFVKVTALEDLELLIGKVPISIVLMRIAEDGSQVSQVSVKHAKYKLLAMFIH